MAIEVAIMTEGQLGMNWPRWQRMARTVEDSGYAGLYRSDHYTEANPPDMDSLELWTSLTWLAGHTNRIEFGPLVSPVSFRNPTMTARMAAAVDDLSGGRLRLGVGAGWQNREHYNYGWDLLSVRERLSRFQEGLEVITRLLTSDKPVDFAGKYFWLHDAILLPRPHRRIPIVIGGNGEKRTLSLVARYADEWNGVFLTPERYKALNTKLDEAIQARGRELTDVRRTLMTQVAFGKDEARLQQKLNGRDPDQLRQAGHIVGTANAVIEQLGRLAEVGVQRIMLQWLDLDDLEGVEAMAHLVVPQVSRR
jgi:F420-dependent oxidoreductase-like protein